MGGRTSSVWGRSGAWRGRVGRSVAPARIWGAGGASCHFGTGHGVPRSQFGDVEPVWARGRCPMRVAGRWGAMGGVGGGRETRMRFFERCHRPPAGDTMRSTRGQSTSGRLSRRCSGGGSHKLGMGPLWGMKGAGGAVGGSGTHLGCRRSNLPFWGRGAIGNGSGGYGAGLKGSMWQLGHVGGWGSAHGHSGTLRDGLVSCGDRLHQATLRWLR